ncbi:MAG TPA: tetratricopeptide repeat protein [Candidatus Latescibacteria bacterium]|nr:tetratricopeptide repeat protein [Candidatus Latescibacterota bacterium]
MRGSIILWIFLWASWASPAELLRVRAGGHWGFSRLVFDFDRRVLYSTVRLDDGGLRLSFLGAEYRGAEKWGMRDRRVGRVYISQMGETIVATVHIRKPVAPRPYSLEEDGVFKVVVDLYDLLPSDLYLRRGREYLKEGLYEEALAMFQGVLTLYPSYAEARLEVGRTLKMMGDYEGALHSFHQVPASSPAWGEAQAELAMLYRRLGREEVAVESWREVARWARSRFGILGDTLRGLPPSKGDSEGRWGIVTLGYMALLGMGGYGLFRVLRRRRYVPTDAGELRGEHEGTVEPSVIEQVRIRTKRGESKEIIAKELGMSVREVELALRLKGKL